MTFHGSVGPGIDTYPLIAGIPPLILQCNLTVVGASGRGIYTYFIVANYPLGQVVSGPYTIYNAPNIFSGGNYVRLDWQPTPNATTYDILRFTGIVTSLAGITTNSEIATGLTVTTFNNTAGSIGNFTTNLIGNSQIDLAIENQTSAYARVYFNPIAGGPFELDLSAFANVIIPGGGSAGPAAPNSSVQFNNTGIFGGDSNFEWDDVNKLAKVGGSPITPFAGLYVGPDESGLNAYIQDYFHNRSSYVTNVSAIPGTNVWGQYVAVQGAATSSANAYQATVYSGAASSLYGGQAYVSDTNANVYGVTLNNGVIGTNIAANSYGFIYNDLDLPDGGGVITQYAVFSSEITLATNNYYSWFDSQGVRRIKEDNTFNTVGQAIEALYNPQFTKYTPGAADYERIVLGQWESNVAVITTEKGGTGTLRNMRIGDAGVVVEIDLLNIASGGSTTISTGVGAVKMSTTNVATNTAWIPIKYAGTTYYVPAWTTNAP